ncbi:MAG: UvrD-helicase domain-containing protein, partial [Thermoplasmata archaeon]|nr:UvrD-helicase domain-containing protein [Thermoplasmata archaeon]
MELDEQQAKAVKTVSPKAMVLAGAGSGKTRVLTERIYHLVKDQNVSLFDIMAFSFTRRASNEIRTRLEDRIGPVIHRAYLGTMHSIALSFLRRFGRSIGLKMANITVYSEWESSYLLRDVAMAMGVLKRNKWNPGKTKIKEVFDLYYST